MSRLAITQNKKQRRKEFNKQFLKKYTFFLVLAGLTIAMMLGIVLTVSKAVANHENTVDLIRNHQYVDVDFR